MRLPLLIAIVSSLVFCEGDHLVFNRITITPSVGEMISIFNPTSVPQSLDNYYITDATDSSEERFYYNITNEEPPFVGWEMNYDPYVHSPLGRYFKAGFTYRMQ